MFDNIRNKDFIASTLISETAKDLLSRLLVKDPTKRLANGLEIMKHSFYKEINWVNLI